MRKQPPQPPHFSRESLIADTLFRASQIPDSALAGSSKNGVYFTIGCIPTANCGFQSPDQFTKRNSRPEPNIQSGPEVVT